MENPFRIVLFRNSAKLPQVIGTVATKGILVLAGVVKVDVFVVLVNGLRIIFYLCDSGIAYLLEQPIVARVLP